jgi:thiamine-phosphate pyrophosphorylase
MDHSEAMSRLNVAVYRILDANLDRAREGLRVIEEWCRFGLNSPDLTETCKKLRHELGQLHRAEFRSVRDTPGDVGTQLTHAQELQRVDVNAVLQSNFGRVQEALRVLEEYGKVDDPALGEACKQIRYRVYTLESTLMGISRLPLLRQEKLYLVTSPSEELLAIVEAALQGGLRLVQYRAKSMTDQLRLQEAQALRSLCTQYQALFIVNDRIDLALAVGADGVHLGQDDFPVDVARQLLGSHRIIGRSTTNPQELQQAIQEKVDYIGVGPVYATPTKTDKTVAGLEYVRYAAKHAPMPWYCIGGIDVSNIPAVLKAGGDRVAVVRAIMEAADPQQAVQALNRMLRNGLNGETEEADE